MQYIFNDRRTYITSIEFQNTSPIVNIEKIVSFREDGIVGNFTKKEFCYSFNNITWSPWQTLNITNLSSIDFRDNQYFYLHVKYSRNKVIDGNIDRFSIIYDSKITTPSIIYDVSIIDADFLQGKDGEYYLNFSNHYGKIPTSSLTFFNVGGEVECADIIDASEYTTIRFRTFKGINNVIVYQDGDNIIIDVSDYTLKSYVDGSLNDIRSQYIPDFSLGYKFIWDTSGLLDVSIRTDGAQGVQGTQGTVGAQGTQGVQGSLGLQGAQGKIGSQGISGAQGKVGAQGSIGYQGVQGSIGIQGIQGTQGRVGSIGLQGVQGHIGSQGLSGVQGAQGNQGQKGDKGDQGIQGLAGSQGAIGSQGSQGMIGLKGDKGDVGSQGLAGSQGLVGSQGVQGSRGLKGDDGAQGVQGSIGIQGSQGMSVQGSAGKAGDQGAQGTQGAQGLSGIQGAQGSEGQRGVKGDTGSQGVQGTQGTQGAQGIQGVVGCKGEVGAQGTQGTQGRIGSQGIQGNVGYGSQGVQGAQGTAIQGVQGNVGIQGIQGATGSGGGASDASINELYQWQIIQDASIISSVIYTSSLDPSITMPSAVGGIPAGTTVSQLNNKTFSYLWDSLLFPTAYPTLTNPSATFVISSPSSTLQEVSANISIQFSATFNRGSISPQYSADSPYRSGPPNKYNYSGTGLPAYVDTSALSNSQTVSSYYIKLGNQSWSSYVSYDAGCQPKDSKGNNYMSPLPAGNTSTITRTITGVYPIFATTVDISLMTKQTLYDMNTVGPITLSLVAEVGGYKQAFELPNAWIGAPTNNPLTGIRTYNTVSGQWEYQGGTAAASLTKWTSSSTTETIQGYVINYTKYTYNQTDRSATQIRLEF